MAIITHNIPNTVPTNGASYSLSIENNDTNYALHVRLEVSGLWVNPDSGNLTIPVGGIEIITVDIQSNTFGTDRSGRIEVFGSTYSPTETLLDTIEINQRGGLATDMPDESVRKMLLIPTANPIRFSSYGINEIERAKANYVDYYQKFQKSDTTKVQILVLQSSFRKDWNIRVYNEFNVKVPYTFNKVIRSGLIDDYEVHEFAINFSQFAEGLYRFELYNSGTTTYKTGLMCVRQEQPFTVLLRYGNTDNTQSVAFSSGVMFNLRVESEPFNDLLLRSNTTSYTDNLGGFSTLSSAPFNNRMFNIGGRTGVPDWLMEIVNQAFSCDTLYADGKRINKVEEAEFEALEAENYNLRSWIIEVGKVENNLIYEGSATPPINPSLTSNVIGFSVEGDEIRINSTYPVTSQLMVNIRVLYSNTNGIIWSLPTNIVANISIGEYESSPFKTIGNETNIICEVISIYPAQDSQYRYVIGDRLEWASYEQGDFSNDFSNDFNT